MKRNSAQALAAAFLGAGTLLLASTGAAQEKTPQNKTKTAQRWLWASLGGKIAGLGLGAGALLSRDQARQTQLVEGGSADAEARRALAFELGTGAAWGLAAVTGGVAFSIESDAVRPWMFSAETLGYGALGLALGGLALREASVARDSSGAPEEQELAAARARDLGIRAGIFATASASALVARYALRRLQSGAASPVAVSVGPAGAVLQLGW
jgi:hypothetical protein